MKKEFLGISQNSEESTCVRAFLKLQASACSFIKKEILAQAFSCEFCEISKNTFSYRIPLAAASACNSLKQLANNNFLRKGKTSFKIAFTILTLRIILNNGKHSYVNCCCCSAAKLKIIK